MSFARQASSRLSRSALTSDSVLTSDEVVAIMSSVPATDNHAETHGRDGGSRQDWIRVVKSERGLGLVSVWQEGATIAAADTRKRSCGRDGVSKDYDAIAGAMVLWAEDPPDEDRRAHHIGSGESGEAVLVGDRLRLGHCWFHPRSERRKSMDARTGNEPTVQLDEFLVGLGAS